MFLALIDTDLAQFLYNLFDSDRSGALDVTEVKSIIATVHQKLLNGRNPIQRLLEDLSKKDHRMTSEEFVSWTKTNPSLLEPIFHLHLDLRNQLIGNNFWQTIQTRRYAAGNQTSAQYIDLVQKRLEKISKDLEKKGASASKKKKKVHPSSGKKSKGTKDDDATDETEEKKSAYKKQQSTGERNVVLTETEKSAPRKKSFVPDSPPEAASAAKPRKKSNIGLEVDVRPLSEPKEKEHKHHHHHHHHHHRGEDKSSSSPSPQRQNHHSGNPSPATRPNFKQSHTSSM
jgi:hypothetical protein